MAASLGYVLAQIQHWTSPHFDKVSDAVLLQHFVQKRDESAFTALVARHGAMVMRSCERILGDRHEAEDAFQATFLILARKAHSLRQADALPGFLHSVARHVALKVRKKVLFSSKQTPLSDELSESQSDPLARLTGRELLTVLDEEVSRLPKTQRSAVVMCCLEGRSQEEAAHLLGWTAGSLRGHLQRGRQRLQARLRRRGIALSVVLGLAAVSHGAAAPTVLVRDTISAVLGGGGSAAALAQSVLRTMLWSKLAGVMTLVLGVTFAASTTAALVYLWPVAETPEEKTPAVHAASKDAGTGKPPVRTNVPDDPLPEGAIARLGTHRFRHGGLISFTAFSPDSKRLVSQGQDGVRVWDAANGKQLHYFAPEPGKMWGATDLSPDGKSLAAALNSSDGKIDIWDISSGKKTVSFGQGYYAVVRYSPDGKRLAVFEMAKGWLRAVEVWDLASQRRLLSWKPHEPQQVMNLLFSPDSRKLFTCASDGKVRAWETATDRQLSEFKRLDWELARNNFSFFNQNEALSPDGKLLALCEVNDKDTARISLRNTMTGEQVRLLTRPTQKARIGRQSTFSALTFTPDGKKLLTGGPDDFLRAWDTATGEELRRWPLEFGLPYALTVSRDGKTLAVVMNQGKAIQLLDMASGNPRPSHAGHLAQVWFSVFTPEGRTVVTCSFDGLFLWDVVAKRVRLAFKGYDGSIAFLQLSPDGRKLYAVGWGDKTVRVWDAAKGEEDRQIPLGRDYEPSPFGALALTPDGKTIAVMSSTQIIRLFDTDTGRELRSFKGPEWIQGSAFAADGRSLVIWSGDLKVGIWDALDGRRLREYPLPQELHIGQPRAIGGPAPTSYHAALSPDGRLLAIGNNRPVLPPEKCFLVFKDLATGRDLRRLNNLPVDVNRLAFSPDGRMLALSGATDPTIYLMETASGRVRGRFTGHSGAVLSLAFSADGKRLISGSMDTTAMVWDLRSRWKRRTDRASLNATEVERLWTDLAGEDASRAYEAIHKLAAEPNVSLPFLRNHLPPVPAVDEKRLADLIAELESNDFAVRQKAAVELETIGERALPAYRKALGDKPSLETRRRLEDLQEKAQSAWWDVSRERLRSLRAIETLEVAKTKEAREVLQLVAAGAKGARLTEEAKAALKRLPR